MANLVRSILLMYRKKLYCTIFNLNIAISIETTFVNFEIFKSKELKTRLFQKQALTIFRIYLFSLIFFSFFFFSNNICQARLLVLKRFNAAKWNFQQQCKQTFERNCASNDDDSLPCRVVSFSLAPKARYDPSSPPLPPLPLSLRHSLLFRSKYVSQKAGRQNDDRGENFYASFARHFSFFFFFFTNGTPFATSLDSLLRDYFFSLRG